ncbi:MAG: hypothetical protein IKV07_04235 [Bacteroidaceae bacterium]|nr:hypothetical protein [Bacteroidaceae bacterium]
MKKNYFFAFFAGLMLFMAMPISAQVSSMSDLFGKYKFTATITPTEAGAAYADFWTDECEVEITEDGSGWYLASIKNFLGADYTPSVSGFDATNNTFTVNNPNGNYKYWNDMSGYNGVTDTEGTGIGIADAYAMQFSFDPETKEITIPDFTIAGFAWPAGECVTTIYANVTNVKMTLLQAEKVEIPDIAGQWTFAGSLRYADKSPKSFTVDLEPSDATLKNWDAKVTFEGFESAAVTLPATFDGSLLVIPFDNLVLSEKDSIRLGTRTSATAKQGTLEFKYTSSTAMMLWSYIYVRKDTIKANADGEMVEGGMTYQVFEGDAYITREDPNAYDWSGTYNVTVPASGCDVIDDSEVFPTEFNMVISKTAAGFSITEFLGYNDYTVNYPLTVAADGKSAEVALTSYYGPAMLKYIGEVDGDYLYHVLSDGNGAATSLRLTLQDDGSILIGDFCVQSWMWMANEYNPYVLMSSAKAVKEKFDWAGTYVATSTVVEEGGSNNFSAEFEIVIEQVANGDYLVKNVMGYDVYTINQGFFQLNVAEDGNSATVNPGAYYGCLFLTGKYPDYYTLNDINGGVTLLNLVLNADKTVSIDDFTVYYLNYATYASSKCATYSNVVLTKKAEETAIENVVAEAAAVEGIFDMQGRKIDAITAPGLYIVNGKKVLVK